MLPECSTIIKQAIKLVSMIFVFPVAIHQFLKISCSIMEKLSAWNISLVLWSLNSLIGEYGEDIWSALKVRFNYITQMFHFSSFFINFFRFISHVDILVHVSKHQMHLKVAFCLLAMLVLSARLVVNVNLSM